MRHLAFLLLLATMSLSSCSSAPDRIDWSEPPSGASPSTDPMVVENGDTYRLEVGQTDDPNSADPPGTCLQMVFRGAPLGCLEASPLPGQGYGLNVQVRVGDGRMIWLSQSTADWDAERRPDRYIVWSSSSPDGRRIEPFGYGATISLIWEMQPGEEPWGIDTLDADGLLISSRSLVGLPGE